MGNGSKRASLGVLMMGIGLLAAAPVPLAALQKVQPGQWQLKEIGGTETRALCLADPATVLQLAHPGARCTRAVLDDTPGVLTVHYTCPGAGHGRSTVTYRTPQSFRIQTQGFAGGAPFDLDMDARRTGDCPGAAASPTTGR